MNLKSLIQIDEPVPGVASDILFEIGAFPVTNSFLLILFIALLFALGGWYIARNFTVVPNGIQGAVEMVYEGIISLVSSITPGEKYAKFIFPVVATLIIYIGVANLLVFIPGLTSIEYGQTAIFRAPMSDYNTTFGLAFALIVVINLISVKDFGLFGYLGKFFQFKQLWQGMRGGLKTGFEAFIQFLIGLLDIISEGAKVISLSFRLFGNVFAGEVLTAILLGSIAYVVPSLWMALSILFGLIQAMVFGALVAAYYSSSVKLDMVEQESN